VLVLRLLAVVSKALIESYIGDTFGAPTEFGAGGIGLSAGGTTLYGESAAVGTLYRVYEDIRNFAYAVWIKNTVTPDIASLTRELKWITPAHITMTLDNTKANILDYMRTVLNLQPVGFWRLNDLTDSSGNANGLTANGGITAGGVASPGLLVATGNSDNAATLFDGWTTTSYQMRQRRFQRKEGSSSRWVLGSRLPRRTNTSWQSRRVHRPNTRCFSMQRVTSFFKQEIKCSITEA
jgi:hypothetical protein